MKDVLKKMFAPFSLASTLERDAAHVERRLQEIELEKYVAARSALWRQCEIDYLRKLNELQRTHLEDVK